MRKTSLRTPSQSNQSGFFFRTFRIRFFFLRTLILISVLSGFIVSTSRFIPFLGGEPAGRRLDAQIPLGPFQSALALVFRMKDLEHHEGTRPSQREERFPRPSIPRRHQNVPFRKIGFKHPLGLGEKPEGLDQHPYFQSDGGQSDPAQQVIRGFSLPANPDS